MDNAQSKPIFILTLQETAKAVALSTAAIERLEKAEKFPKRRELSGRRVGYLVREVQQWAESRPVSDIPPPPNTGAPKRKEAA